MTITLDEFVEDIQTDFSEAPEVTIERAVREAAIEFFHGADHWRVEEEITTNDTDIEYQFNIPMDSQFHAVKRVFYREFDDKPYLPLRATTPFLYPERRGVPREWYRDGTDTIILDAAKVCTIRVHVNVIPVRNWFELPEYETSQWYEHIKAGAFERLLSKPKQPWSDITTAGRYRAYFLEGVSSAKRYAERTPEMPARKVAYGGL